MRLSVAMIVRNEEACLAVALRSVEGADELIVVDTGSTDRTKEIAVVFGAKLFDFPWVDDFAAARNYALQQCTGDWVITIDADEELEPRGIEKIREAVACAHSFKTIGVKLVARGQGDTHTFPRVYKHCPEVFWKGAVHNYLSVVEANSSDVVIVYGYSDAHKSDPDRSLRILTKVLNENPMAVREAYYLAREYWYRKDYATAAKWYADYLSKATWAPEMSDAWLMLARCSWQMRQGDLARDACLHAIKINADFKEALLFMAEMSGPKNRERWKLFAALAGNEDVLFLRDMQPKSRAYYDKVFAGSKDMSRYALLLKKAADWTQGSVLDICCGTGELGKYVTNYRGIDFSSEAVRDNPRLSCGDVFVEELRGYDTYVMLETLEHLDDISLLRRLSPGSDVVFSVPSFEDPAHVRTYNERIVRIRYAELMHINKIERFNWSGSVWDKDHENTTAYILLVKAKMR